MPFLSPSIERYCQRHSARESRLLGALERTTRRLTEMPQMMVGPLEGRFLGLLAALIGARRVLEIGTFTGYSALCFAEALPPTGRVITCDIDASTVAIARRYWKKSPHGRKITALIGPATQTVSRLAGPFDLVFIDADKLNYRRYWDLAVTRVRKGGLIVVDNVLWSGRVLRPRDKTDRAIAAFNRNVKKDRRIEAVMLTVRDGMTLARKK